MSIPFFCGKCEAEKNFEEAYPIYRECEKCGGRMEIDYQDNHEQIPEVTLCHTCVHNFEKEGKHCEYCSNI